MITPDGHVTMLPADFQPEDFDAAKEAAGLREALPVRGTQDEIEKFATRVRLGNAEIERRQKRRAQQKTSRRQNR